MASRSNSEPQLELPYLGQNREVKPYITFRLMLEGLDLVVEAKRYTEDGKFAQAEHILIEHLHILINQYGTRDERLCESLLGLSGNYLSWEKFEAAERYAQMAKQVYEQNSSRHSLDAQELLDDIQIKKEGLAKTKRGKKVYRRRSSSANNEQGDPTTDGASMEGNGHSEGDCEVETSFTGDDDDCDSDPEYSEAGASSPVYEGPKSETWASLEATRNDPPDASPKHEKSRELDPGSDAKYSFIAAIGIIVAGMLIYQLINKKQG